MVAIESRCKGTIGLVADTVIIANRSWAVRRGSLLQSCFTNGPRGPKVPCASSGMAGAVRLQRAVEIAVGQESDQPELMRVLMHLLSNKLRL